MEGRFPNFLIPGAGKSGTTSLAYYLAQHPDVFMALPKEPTFFSYVGATPRVSGPERSLEKAVTSLDAYLALFNGAGNHKAVGEASTFYFLLYQQTIDNIRRLVPSHEKIRIIIILRDPVERAYSNYVMFRALGVEHVSFEEAIEPSTIDCRLRAGWSPSYDYVGEGLYYERVKAYKDCFPMTRVYLYEDLVADAAGLVSDMFSFLDVDPHFKPDIGRRLNVGRLPRSQIVHRFVHSYFPLRRVIKAGLELAVGRAVVTRLIEWTDSVNGKTESLLGETRERLRAYYKNDVLALARLIGRDLSGWIVNETQQHPA